GWRAISAVAGVVSCALLSAAAAPAAGPAIGMDDVALFYQVYDAASGHPTAEQLQSDYLDRGSDGLHQFAKVRNTSGASIAAALAKRPEIYGDSTLCVPALPRVRTRLEAALGKLAVLYPEAKLPPVTIAVGRGKPVAVGS